MGDVRIMEDVAYRVKVFKGEKLARVLQNDDVGVI